ncbi:MAG: cupin [Pseudomonadota bacterium]
MASLPQYALILSAALSAFAASAKAGECPEEHRLTEPRTLERASNQGVTVAVREQLDMNGWRELGNFRLRTRHFTIAPGGTVANHNHADRPSIIYFVSGEIFEHNALCAVPILHKAGETTGEFGADVRHWWNNESAEPVVLISSDVVPFRP